MTVNAPNLMDVVTRPREFFTALRATSPRSARYLWLVLLGGLITGLYSALSQRPVQEAMAGIPGMPGGNLNLIIAVVGGVIITLLLWLLLWGLGALGAGAEGRAAEVYGASTLPALLLTLLLLPITALFPLHVNVPAPNFAGLEGQELAQAIRTYSAALQRDLAGQPLSVLGKVLSYAGMAWQFYVAWVGFNVLTGDRSKSLRGVLIPLVVLLLLGGAFWFMGRAAQGLTGA